MKIILSDSEEDIYYGLEIFLIVWGECDCGFESLMKKLYFVLNKLYFLRDSGNFKEFNSLVDCVFLVSKGDDEFEILIFIEKSVVVSY